MRWSFIFSSTGSMSSRDRLLEPTRPFSIPNIPPKPPLFLELRQTTTKKSWVFVLSTTETWWISRDAKIDQIQTGIGLNAGQVFQTTDICLFFFPHQKLIVHHVSDKYTKTVVYTACTSEFESKTTSIQHPFDYGQYHKANKGSSIFLQWLSMFLYASDG